ncbi:hypothetical protein BIZ78_gp233 [Erwinia phage vB_EamM_Caitlin]|uniref:hypothetical protein n=1 Tax=Erwinia phage vB_EamM_Caitlin TaxID=1883379 RepID=UPI00081C7EF1|nr:hypothetical protein BIZ78_gp233 [Erwinia phage vB_EamM_Caitlin]ANZ48342.1 hypothetical protein CAITLIN_47 [Erwinia phage vB_EamM_Caitlin]
MSLAKFLEVVLRAYPGVEDVAKVLCQDPKINRAFHYYMVTEHYAGLFIEQRGLRYHVTRTSNIRGTAAYELYTYTLWTDNPAGSVDQNPKMAYALFSEKWHDWVTVPHNVS